jgi:hypothetical protein
LMSVFPRLPFVVSRFRVFLIDGSSKTLQKHFCKKNVSCVEKLLQKNRPKIQSRCFLDLFHHVSGRLAANISPLSRLSNGPQRHKCAYKTPVFPHPLTHAHNRNPGDPTTHEPGEPLGARRSWALAECVG